MGSVETSNPGMLLEPSAKKRVNFPREYPFPIVRNETGSSKKDWNCIIGILKEDCVHVIDKDSMKMLFMMGFFGKGTLSKSAPKICFPQSRSHSSDENSSQESSHEEKPSRRISEDEFIEVVVCDDNNQQEKRKKKRKREEIEVVLSGHSSESSDEESPASKKKKKELENLSEKEQLQLTFEEAFFLSYGLGCLVVKDKDQPMDLLRLWHKFCDLSPAQNFPVLYTAYHHFRSKGWVVRSGLKYGVDYVLYKDGPPFYHSTYAVIVKPVKEQNLREINIDGKQPMTWSSLAALNRICTHSGKGLMLLYVIKPNSMSENKVSTPFCISQYKLEEVLIKRWVPAENREDTSE